MILDLLRQQKVLLVHGSAFNFFEGVYFRLVFLPHQEELEIAIEGMQKFFETYGQA